MVLGSSLLLTISVFIWVVGVDFLWVEFFGGVCDLDKEFNDRDEENVRERGLK